MRLRDGTAHVAADDRLLNISDFLTRHPFIDIAPRGKTARRARRRVFSGQFHGNDLDDQLLILAQTMPHKLLNCRALIRFEIANATCDGFHVVILPQFGQNTAPIVPNLEMEFAPVDLRHHFTGIRDQVNQLTDENPETRDRAVIGREVD